MVLNLWNKYLVLKQKHFILILIITGLLVFSPAFFNGFVWDDEEQIVKNEPAHSIKNIGLFFAGSTFNTGGQAALSGLYYKPLMTISFAFLYTLFGSNAFFFHFFQISLHIINSILVFFLFKNLIFKKKRDKLWFTCILALIFLVHPINSETAIYISALQDVLFFIFGISALLLIIYLDKYRIYFLSKYQNILIPFLIVFLLLFSLLGKETGILFLGICFIGLIIWQKAKALNYSMLLFFVLLIYGFMRIGLAKVFFDNTGNIMPITRADLAIRLQTMPKIIFYYLKTFIFPKDLAISQHWLVEKIDIINLWIPLFLISIVFLLISYFIYYLYKYKPSYLKTYIFFYIWFCTGVFMHSQIVPLDMTVAERWFYFQSVGLIAMIGIFILKFNLHHKKYFPIIIFLIVFLLSARTFIRTFNWKEGLTLYNHDIKINQNAFDLENNLGAELFRVKRVDEACPHFEKSTQLAPDWWTNWSNLGVCYQNKNEFAKAEEYYLKGINNGKYYIAYQNYTAVLMQQSKFKEAEDFLTKVALPRFPFNDILRTQYLYIQQNKVK